MVNYSIVAPFIVYLLILLAIGIIANRYLVDLEGYLLGGRGLGAGVTALTLQSTSMSGFMFLGAPSMAFRQGVWALWYAIGDFGGGLVNLAILGRGLRQVSETFGSLTPIEYLEDRYPHPSIRAVGSLISIVFLSAYVFAQFIAAGKALEAVTGVPYIYGLLLGTSIIVLYTFFGGYLAVAWTDTLQAIVMALGINILLAAVLMEVGGFTGLFNSIASKDPTYLSVWGQGFQHAGAYGVVIGAVLLYSIGYMGIPHAVVRHLSMEESDTAKSAIGINVFFNTFFVYQPYILGLAAIVLLPSLNDPEMAIPQLALTLLPTAVAGILLAALMAAVMSTADSILIMAGSILSRDIVQRFSSREISDERAFLYSRALVVGIGVLGIIVAAYQPPSVSDLVIFAFGALACAFLVPNIAGVYWTRANWQGALAAMIGGSGTNIIWTAAGLQSMTAVHPFLAGIVVSTIGMVVFSLITEPPSADVIDAVQTARESIGAPTGTVKQSTDSLAPEATAIATHLSEKSLADN